MILKTHVCGMAVVYEPVDTTPNNTLTKIPARPNGSLYSRQKRAIADATEYLRLKHHNDRQRKAVIFCLTTPGNVSIANTPKFISRFVDNMRANYGLGEYVWVREHTKRGFPHFHFIAEWHTAKWFFEKDEDGVTRIENISLYWSSLFSNNVSNNSVRLGSYDPKSKKRTLYVSHPRQCWYLVKYIGKSIGESSMDYLAEAGFPSVVYKKTVRAFAISEALRQWSEPTIFDEEYIDTETGEVIRSSEGFRCAKSIERKWQSYNSGMLIELNRDDVRAYNWRWTGNGQTYIGIKGRPRTRKTLDRGQ